MFIEGGVPLNSVTEFKCTGTILASTDDDWTAICGNLVKERKTWAIISKILTRGVAYFGELGMFYQVVVQSLLLLGTETWVPPSHMFLALDGSHIRSNAT